MKEGDEGKGEEVARACYMSPHQNRYGRLQYAHQPLLNRSNSGIGKSTPLGRNRSNPRYMGGLGCDSKRLGAGSSILCVLHNVVYHSQWESYEHASTFDSTLLSTLSIHPDHCGGEYLSFHFPPHHPLPGLSLNLNIYSEKPGILLHCM